jgi:hypothetical protein
MTTLPRSLAVQQVTIAIFIILAMFQAYLVFISPEGMSLRGWALIANPLGLSCVFMADYPKFKQTAARIPMISFGFGLVITSVYILLMHKFS